MKIRLQSEYHDAETGGSSNSTLGPKGYLSFIITQANLSYKYESRFGAQFFLGLEEKPRGLGYLPDDDEGNVLWGRKHKFIHAEISCSREYPCCIMLLWLCVCIPRHVLPFPTYPSLQAHENEPTVLTHAALLSHTGVPLVHSSTSKEYNKINSKQTVYTSGKKLVNTGCRIQWTNCIMPTTKGCEHSSLCHWLSFNLSNSFSKHFWSEVPQRPRHD